jgi:hypothetical protein
MVKIIEKSPSMSTRQYLRLPSTRKRSHRSPKQLPPFDAFFYTYTKWWWRKQKIVLVIYSKLDSGNYTFVVIDDGKLFEPDEPLTHKELIDMIDEYKKTFRQLYFYKNYTVESLYDSVKHKVYPTYTLSWIYRMYSFISSQDPTK